MNCSKSLKSQNGRMWTRPLDFVDALSYNKNINALLTPFGPAGFSFKYLA